MTVQNRTHRLPSFAKTNSKSLVTCEVQRTVTGPCFDGLPHFIRQPRNGLEGHAGKLCSPMNLWSFWKALVDYGKLAEKVWVRQQIVVLEVL